MGSIVWSDDESQYIRAILKWRDEPQDDRMVDKPSGAPIRFAPETRGWHPVGEFRILVLGAQGVGKTSLLTRFCTGHFSTSASSASPAKPPIICPLSGGSCRHPIEIDSQIYALDALELPAAHLINRTGTENDDAAAQRPLLLEQVVGITEATILVYDVRRPETLRQCLTAAERVRRTVGTREYGLVLVGNKSDDNFGVDSEAVAGDTATRHDGEDSQGDRASEDGTQYEEGENEDRATRAGRKQPGDHPAVTFAEGSSAAAALPLRCVFIEASARAGKDVTGVFALAGREVLRTRRINTQRRLQAERDAVLRMQARRRRAARELSLDSSAGDDSDVRTGKTVRLGFWRTVATPFFTRCGEGDGEKRRYGWWMLISTGSWEPTL
ncbi:hypothetical protein NKR23_g1290 [Pleurostoma richardsiae]|uniref:Uncharacterized protein n=1 Tax=Pleurostoma richardsiae TaxID=41990 RepID=A0AA38S5T2_9PEZI|nr:hypothetical protein NKR23_g1290 [Pleurostoma richardsiae]